MKYQNILFLLLLSVCAVSAQPTSIQQYFHVDTIIPLQTELQPPLVYSSSTAGFYYVKGVMPNEAAIAVSFYHTTERVSHDLKFRVGDEMIRDIQRNGLRSLNITGPNLYLLTAENLSHFLIKENSVCSLLRKKNILNKQGRIYLPLYAQNEKVWMARYSEPVPDITPYFEVREINFASNKPATVFRTFDGTGQMYLNSKQYNQVCIGFGKIVWADPVDYRIAISGLPEGNNSYSFDTLARKVPGWISIKKEVLNKFEAAYLRKPSISILDTLAILEQKYISHINHVLLMDSLHLLVSYTLNDTSRAILDMPVNKYTSKNYVDIWELQTSGWKLTAQDITDDATLKPEQLVSKDYFVLGLNFSEVIAATGKIGYISEVPEFSFGESWRDFNKKRYEYRVQLKPLKPVFILFNRVK